MPVEAFADLWKTLKVGRPWVGLVKNRCKNGDYYWVEAHATPLYENGKITGYMSVRKKANRQQVEATEGVYRQFRENKAGGMRIELGRVVSGAGLGGKFADLSIKTKLSWVMLLLSAVTLVIGVMGLTGMSKTNEGLRDVYELHMIGLSDVTGINRNVLRNRILTEGALLDPTPENVAKKFEEMKANIATITKSAEEYKARMTDPDQKQFFERFATDRGNFVKEGLLAVMDLLKAGKVDEARKIFFEKTEPLNGKVVEHVNNLRKFHVDGAKREFGEATARYESSRSTAITLIIVGLLLAVTSAVVLIRSIVAPLSQATDIFMRISQGLYGNFVDITRNDETGKFLQALEVMQTRLGFDVAEAARISDENLRIKIALDNVSTGVMIANNERTVIYANKSVQRILKGAESAIRQQLPSFDADKMMGVNIDTFHKNPAHQAKLLAEFTSTYVANLEIGGRYLRVTASPVINARGDRLGAVAEWLDRTGEVMVEKEVANIVEGALRGDFVTRLSLGARRASSSSCPRASTSCRRLRRPG